MSEGVQKGTGQARDEDSRLRPPPDYARFQNINVEKADKVATLLLNHPEDLNAVSEVMHQELEDVFEDLDRDAEVNVIVITGAGRAFSAGGDIKRMKWRIDNPSATQRARMEEGTKRLVHNVARLDKPMVAAVNGDAIGLGATLALFSDVVYMAETARLADPHVRMGLVAGDGGCVIWPLLVGISRAKQLLMTGDLVTAQEAERLGLVYKVLPADQVYPAALEFARRLAAGPTRAICWIKHSVNKWLQNQMNLVLDTSAALQTQAYNSDDHCEAVQAFLEKRRPKFTGK